MLRPANGYVADFVAHLNPLSVLTATDAMVGGRRARRSRRGRCAPDAPLKDALPFFAASPDPVWVVRGRRDGGQDHLARGLFAAGRGVGGGARATSSSRPDRGCASGGAPRWPGSG